MGWYPARDKTNRVPPENLYFNQPEALHRALQGGNNVIKLPRGAASSSDNRGEGGKCNKRGKGVWARVQCQLTQQALARGYLNGVRVR